MDSRTFNNNNSYHNHNSNNGRSGSFDPRSPESRTAIPKRNPNSVGQQRGLLGMRERGTEKDGRAPLRVVVVGAPGVGKTALTVRLITKRFIGEYCPTLENVYNYQCTVDDEDVKLEVLDTAGEAEDAITDFYATWGDCYVWIYSITDKPSLEKLTSLHEQWSRRRRQGACVHVLLGNKTDLGHQRQVMGRDGQTLAKAWECSFHEISVAEGEHTSVITDIFKNIVRKARQIGLLSVVDNTNHKKNVTPSSVAMGKFRHAIQKVMLGGKMSPKINKKNNNAS